MNAGQTTADPHNNSLQHKRSQIEDKMESGPVSVQVIPIGDLPMVQDQFDAVLSTLPEYRVERPCNLPCVLGGFAAQAAPSTFHHPFIRDLRAKSKEASIDLLKQMSGDRTNCEVLFDRMMYRHPGQAPTAESWHRDVTKIQKYGDIVVGGWLNLDTKPQYFSYIPGSHLGINPSDLKPEFAKLDKADWPQKDEVRSFPIPPGAAIMFPQHIIHEVIATKANYPMRRLFIGYRLTNDKEPLFPETGRWIEEQAVPKIPSGQWPPLYSGNHASCFKHKQFQPIPGKADVVPRVSLIEWCKAMFDETLLLPDGRIPRVFPKSLKQLDKLFLPYSEEHTRMHTPQPL